jgi:hypothetical protein
MKQIDQNKVGQHQKDEIFKKEELAQKMFFSCFKTTKEERVHFIGGITKYNDMCKQCIYIYPINNLHTYEVSNEHRLAC